VRYSALSGGKRLRGILCIAACEAVGGSRDEVLSAACALECIHAYSLVHDDLPAMDNAETRRGKPSCHRRYGEAVAILAGDALLSLGFQLLSIGNHSMRRLDAVRAVAEVVGSTGLIGGQVMDLEWQRTTQNAERRTQRARKLLAYINASKTAKLMSVSATVGALLGGGSPTEVRALEHYGFDLGLLFQWTDDLLDGEGLASVMQQSQAQSAAQRLARRARAHLKRFKARAEPLRLLPDAIVWRTT